MAKYRIELESLVTKLMNRTFVVSANNEADAIEKAETLFLYECARQISTYCDGEINVDSIERIG